ncbi:MAG: hypothetical protein ABW019_11700 [Chitinophagaceae bacterium]
MKKIVLFLLLAFGAAKSSLATEWAWYYIYVQKEYIQGPWTRADLLGKRDDYAYLHPQPFEELFGSEQQDLVNAIFRHLREETPERYTFRSSLSVSVDTVVIRTEDSIPDFDAVKNELVASFVLNNFAAVKIIQPGKVSLYRLGDLTVPYMDLVLPATGQAHQSSDNVQIDTAALNPAIETTPEKPEKKLPVWLILSVGLNLVLIMFLLLRKRN